MFIYNVVPINTDNNVFYNNNAAKKVYYNNLQVWQKESNLFAYGRFGDLGTPTYGNAEGSTFATNQIYPDNRWLINCDGRSDFWFPTGTRGYSTLHISVNGQEGTGHCYMFASPDKLRWGYEAPYFAECTTPGTYTLNIPTGFMYIGVEALMGGIWIQRMWLS